MFGWSKKKKSPPEDQEACFSLQLPPVKSGTSYFGPSLLVTGKIKGKGDIQLLGRHEGSIDVDGDLAIHESAVVSGLVAARFVSVRGAVDGELRARKKLAVHHTARITGTIATPTAVVEEGAVLDGKVEMDKP